jgi:acetyl-CoA synthetase
VKVGCAEIERVLNALPGIHETAAVAIAPPGGGPSRLTIFTVVAGGNTSSVEMLRTQFQKAISSQLNPLFHVHSVVPVDALPRTTSNKIIRRNLRRPAE